MLLLAATTVVSLRILGVVEELRDEQRRQSHCLEVVAQNLAPDPDGGVLSGCPVR